MMKKKLIIHVTNGKFSLIDPLENGYLIENGAKIVADNGDIIVGDVYGKKEILPRSIRQSWNICHKRTFY